jgi:YesN/AraC family two-component response regulator
MIDLKLVLEQTKDIDLLYVEDNEALRESTLKVLENFFNKIDVAEDGLIGLTKYKDKLEKENRSYDLVISDINMPNLNGIEMSEKIISIEPRQGIIFITAHNEVEHLLEAIKLGVDGFVLKPLKLNEFVQVLYKICRTINERKLLYTYLSQIESMNLELIQKNRDLEEKNDLLLKIYVDKKEISEDFVSKDDKVFSEIDELIQNDLVELQDLEYELDANIINLLQKYENNEYVDDINSQLHCNLCKLLHISVTYSFLDEFSNYLSQFNDFIEKNQLPSDKTQKEDALKAIEKTINTLTKWIHSLSIGDKSKIIELNNVTIEELKALGEFWNNEVWSKTYKKTLCVS